MYIMARIARGQRVTDRRPTDGATGRGREEGGRWHIFVQTPLGLSFALEFLPTFWREGEANVGGDKV